MHQPLIASNMVHQSHYMTVAHCPQSRGRQAEWKFPTPVRGKIEFGAYIVHEPRWNNSLKLLHVVAPEILEARRRQLRVAHRVLDVFVPEVILD